MAVLVSLGLAVAGCGGGSDRDTEPPAAATTTGTASAGAPAGPATATTGPVPATLTFTATTVDGQPFDAASVAGKPVVLWFWAAWCPRCRAAAPDVATCSASSPAAVTMLGVAGLNSGTAAMRDFVADRGIGGFTNLADDDGVIWRRFGVHHAGVLRAPRPGPARWSHKGPLHTGACASGSPRWRAEAAMVDVPYALALSAGMLAAVNPCGFALLPAYLSFLSSTTRAAAGRRQIGRASPLTAAMTLGFVAVFGVFGLLAAPAADAVARHLPWVSIASG